MLLLLLLSMASPAGSVSLAASNLLLNQPTSSNLPKVCVLIPVSSRNQGWQRLDESFLATIALPSLARTCEPRRFRYALYVGYDVGDRLFDRTDTLEAFGQLAHGFLPFAEAIVALPFVNGLRKPGPVKNFLSREAYEDGCDFLYQMDDDTELLTPGWTSKFVEALNDLPGVAGPSCTEGNRAVLVHDFVHRGHLDTFPTHYPPALTDWWTDDWMTWIAYPANRTLQLADVEIRHSAPLVRRYDVSWDALRVFEAEFAGSQGKALAGP